VFSSFLSSPISQVKFEGQNDSVVTEVGERLEIREGWQAGKESGHMSLNNQTGKGPRSERSESDFSIGCVDIAHKMLANFVLQH